MQRHVWLISNNNDKVEEDCKICNGSSLFWSSLFSTFQDCTMCKDKWGAMCIDFNENFNNMMFLIFKNIWCFNCQDKGIPFSLSINWLNNMWHDERSFNMMLICQPHHIIDLMDNLDDVYKPIGLTLKDNQH